MTTANQTGLSWGARLLIALLLVLVGAAAATWALARNQQAARFLGVTSPPAVQTARVLPMQAPQQAISTPGAPAAAPDGRVAELEARLARVETAAQRVEGSAGRADALLIAFAARRSIERGVALGYLEPLLVGRFGVAHPRAVSTIVTTSRQPVRLEALVAEYDQLGPALRAAPASEGWWTGFQRELGSLVEIRRADRPSVKPDARYERARQSLAAGEVDSALAETMRMPGAQRAGAWVAKTRQYIAARRALDEIESAALLGTARPSL